MMNSLTHLIETTRQAEAIGIPLEVSISSTYVNIKFPPSIPLEPLHLQIKPKPLLHGTKEIRDAISHHIRTFLPSLDNEAGLAVSKQILTLLLDSIPFETDAEHETYQQAAKVLLGALDNARDRL